MRPLLLLSVLFALALGLRLATRAGPPGDAPGPGPPPEARTAGPAVFPRESAGPAARGAARDPVHPAPDEPDRGTSPTALPDARFALAGRVLDAGSGAPVPGLLLEIVDDLHTDEVVTDGNGCFRTRERWRQGELSFHHLPRTGVPAGSPYEVSWRLAPSRVELPTEAAAAGIWGPTILAERPALVLETHALRPEGTPVEDTEVVLELGWQDVRGGFHPDRVLRRECDEDGRALFALFGEEACSSVLRIRAHEHWTRLASTSLFLDAPLHRGPWRLELVPTGSIRVRVLDSSGELLSRGSVTAVPVEIAEGTSRVDAVRVEEGVAHVQRLAPGPYVVRAHEPETGDLRRSLVEVQSGAEVPVEISFGDGSTVPAVEGRVFDEHGEPLEGVTLRVEVPGSAPGRVTTGAGGAFRYFASEARELVLRIDDEEYNHPFEPTEQRVPFGSADVCFRRTGVLPWRKLVFELVDARTGERLADLDGSVLLHRGPVPRGLGHHRWRPASEGRVALRVPDHGDLFWCAQVPDFLEETGRVPPSTEPGSGATIRVQLRPGFECTARISDARTGGPVKGAWIATADGEVLGRTDFTGQARLVRPEWPGPVRIGAEGYREQLRNPLGYGFGLGAVTLEPLD